MYINIKIPLQCVNYCTICRDERTKEYNYYSNKYAYSNTYVQYNCTVFEKIN